MLRLEVSGVVTTPIGVVRRQRVNHLWNRNDWFTHNSINKRSSSEHSHTVPIAQNYAPSMIEEETVTEEGINS